MGTGPTPTLIIELFSQQSMPTSKLKHVFLHVQEYDDEDRNQYPQFCTKLEAKLEVDGEAIRGNTQRVWYAFGRLTGSAVSRIYPWVEAYKDISLFLILEFLA